MPNIHQTELTFHRGRRLRKLQLISNVASSTTSSTSRRMPHEDKCKGDFVPLLKVIAALRWLCKITRDEAMEHSDLMHSKRHCARYRSLFGGVAHTTRATTLDMTRSTAECWQLHAEHWRAERSSWDRYPSLECFILECMLYDTYSSAIEFEIVKWKIFQT